MKIIDRDGLRLCDIQADLFELASKKTNMSSEVFVRRFMNSKIIEELDNLSFLDEIKTTDDIFNALDEQYGKSNYGSEKYDKDVMYWSGYIYRYFCYTYNISSRQAYKMLPLKYVASTYSAYHTLDPVVAIERLLEAKKISFDEKDEFRRQLDIFRRIKRANKK